MSEGLKPCPHRKVDDSGHILCNWIRAGDRQVSINLCRACPVPQINCEHLRAALEKNAPAPITVQFATGRTEVWDNEPPTIRFQQAACAAKTMPIHSPRDCAGCTIRLAQVVPQNAIKVAAANRPPVPIVSPAIAPPAPIESPSNAAQELSARARVLAERKERERRAAQAVAAPASPPLSASQNMEEPAPLKKKIIQLQDWLAGQVGKKQKPNLPQPVQPDEYGVSEIVYSPIAPTYQEEPGFERCVGWTD